MKVFSQGNALEINFSRAFFMCISKEWINFIECLFFFFEVPLIQEKLLPLY